MDYLLTNLIDWTRRRAGDSLARNREVFTTDGTDTLLLNNDGNIQITSCKLAGVDQVINSDFTQDVNVVTFDPAPTTDLQAVIVYNQSRYSDEQLRYYLRDAVKDVNARLVLGLAVDPSGMVLSDPNNLIVPTTNTLKDDIENLFVLRAAIAVREDITNVSAGDAIVIRDDTTAIDTRATAQSNETRLKAMKDEYKQVYNGVWANRTQGSTSPNIDPFFGEYPYNRRW